VGFHLAVIATFTLPAVVLWWNAWSEGAASTVRCSCLDPGQQVWFIAWPAYALAHGLNPFFSTWLWAPHGVNLLNNASAPLASLVLSPVTWAFGPVAATTLALTLAPGLSAWGCWVACRRFVTWQPACWVAGFVFGYSPFVVESVAQGHLSTGLLVLPPLILVVLHEILVRQQRSPNWCGMVLGVLILAQFLISAEILTITVLIGAVGIVVAAALAPNRVAAKFPFAIRALCVAAVATVVLMAAPVWYLLVGPQHIAGSIWSGLQFIFVASAYQLWDAGTYRLTLWTGAPSGPPPTFLGFAVLGAATASLAMAWRRRTVWFFAVIFIVSTVLSWGGILGLRPNHSAIESWLPWNWFIGRPVFDNVLPYHFSALADLAVALVVAIGLDALRSTRPWRRLPAAARVGVVAGVTVAMLLPVWLTYQAPLSVQPVSLPPWYASAARHVPQGSVITSYPFPASASLTSEPMVWQAVDGMRFRLAGGYVKVPSSGKGVLHQGPPGAATRTLDDLTLTSGTPIRDFTLSAHQLEELRSALRTWGTSYIVVTDTGPAPSEAAGVLTAATGRVPKISQRAWVWDLRSRPLRPRYNAASAASAFASCRNPTTPLGPIPPDLPLPQAFNTCVAAGTHT
jgi:hypothetical protein